MAEQLLPVSIMNAGFYGVNKQESTVTQGEQWAMDAINCVVDRFGRMSSRKGWTSVGNAIAGNPVIQSACEYIKKDGTAVKIVAANNALYTLNGSTYTLLYNTNITANNWQFVNFNNKVYAFQRGHDPLVYDGTTCQPIKNSSGYTGTVQQSNCALAAFGRIWNADTTTDKTVVQYSDLLIGNAYTGGSSGVIDLKSVWAYGMDSITALAQFNGNLIIFGKNNIVIYGNAIDPTNMQLVEQVQGIGCIARDTVWSIGSDILFLSKSGVRSLSRTVQEKSGALHDVSMNVRDELVSYFPTENPDYIKGVYHEPEGIYLLALPVGRVVYCFDTRFPLDNGALRVTTWNNIEPQCFFTSVIDNNLYMGKNGQLGQYAGWNDNGSGFGMVFRTNWLDFGEPTRYKVLKKMHIIVVGAANQNIVAKWATDYLTNFSSSVFTVEPYGIAYFGQSQFGIDSYSSGIALEDIRSPISKSGKVAQMSFETTINGTQVSIQKFDIYAKAGRIA